MTSALRGARSFASAPTLGQPSVGSSLTDQNDLFAEALAAQRQGDVWGAVGAYDRLWARFPSSPLAESAAVERMRLLRDASSARARAAAQQYLARYPTGYAHAEAEAIVVTAP
jgi:outer membrane protein assembly factor BamD (BamD/ComL family)